tara:strand:+ start:648 stop:929 length:282 start_codon:yes stop_codon:yes gene_type:complete
MNLFTLVLLATLSWVTFSVLNELASAKDGKGCCETKDCGISFFDTISWWTNLIIAMVVTVYILVKVYQDIPLPLPGKTVARMVEKGTEMAFGL